MNYKNINLRGKMDTMLMFGFDGFSNYDIKMIIDIKRYKI